VAASRISRLASSGRRRRRGALSLPDGIPLSNLIGHNTYCHSATGIAAVSADEDPVAIAQKCSGDGLRRVRIDMDIATTPSMAG
jgi:hypothetical protein